MVASDKWGYGWRAKIGLIYIASSWVLESEMHLVSPPGVTYHTTRVAVGKVNPEELLSVGRQAVEAARLLGEAPLDAVVLACTSGSFVGGVGYDGQLIEEMRQAAGGVPCTTTATAVVQAMRELGVARIAVATPYTDEVNRVAAAFLHGNGFDVVNLVGLGLDSDHAINEVPLERVYRLTKEVDTKEAEAIFVSCTALRTLPIIQALECDLGKPVVSANQASLWHVLRLAGVSEHIEDFGRLFQI